MPARTLRPILVLVLITTLVLIATMPAEAAWQANRSIHAGNFYVIKNFVAQVDAGISYDVQVIETPGATVDVLLMDEQNFELYKSGSSFEYYNASTLNFEFAHNGTEVGALIDGMEYYLVIDNTDRPMGGAPGNVEVRVEYYFGGYNIQAVIDWEIVLAILIVVAVVVVAIVYLSIILFRKLKRMGQI